MAGGRWQVAGGSAKIRSIYLPGIFYENIKSAWESAEAKDTFLPGIFYENIQSAWESAEVKDTFCQALFIQIFKVLEINL